MKRALGVAAILLGVVAMSVGSAGLAVAQGSGGKGKTGGAPPGNNGTIKIDPNVIGPVGSANVDHANHPHVACQFAVSFFGYDATTDNAVVNFFAQPPSGKFQPVTPIVGPGSFSFTGHGPGNILDASVLYQLDVTGLKANVNQGYHIKVDVEVTDGLLPNGSDDKYKVFWLAPCSVPTTTTSTTPTTLTPTSSTLPEKGSTTTTPSTTTSTTSTTLTPTSSTVPEEGSTTTTPSTTTVATTVPRSSTTTTPRSTPPTTARGTGGQTGTTSTTRPSTHPAAAGSAPGAPSGLAFTNGPVPSGAGTDLGFFSPGSPSSLPWLLIIVGGVLLSGAGTVTLTGSRIRKWIVRA